MKSFAWTPRGWGYNVEFSPNGKILAISDNEKDLRILATDSWEELSRVSLSHPITEDVIRFTPDGESVVAGDKNSTIRSWSTSNLEPLSELSGHAGFLRAIGIHPDGEILISGCDDSTIRLWHLPTQTLLGTLHTCRYRAYECEFSTDGSQLVVSVQGKRRWVDGKPIYGEGQCIVWDLNRAFDNVKAAP